MDFLKQSPDQHSSLFQTVRSLKRERMGGLCWGRALWSNKLGKIFLLRTFPKPLKLLKAQTHAGVRKPVQFCGSQFFPQDTCW